MEKHLIRVGKIRSKLTIDSEGKAESNARSKSKACTRLAYYDGPRPQMCATVPACWNGPVSKWNINTRQDHMLARRNGTAGSTGTRKKEEESITRSGEVSSVLTIFILEVRAEGWLR